MPSLTAAPARRGPAPALAAVIGIAGLLVTAGPALANAPASPRHAIKHPPARPPASPGIGLGSAIPPKPHRTGRNISRMPSIGWTISLASSPSQPYLGQYATLTATTNMDVGPTPYYIRIYDATTSSYVATCSSGTTCSVPVIETTAANYFQQYYALVSDSSASYPPGSIQASTWDNVSWNTITVTMAASPTTVPVGGTATVTATTNANVGPTPFYIEIFDVTTGTLVTTCASGVSCSGTVTQGDAETDDYAAYVTPYDPAYPVPSPESQSPQTSWITWSNAGWSVSLTGPAATAGLGHYTATASSDVGPTPYYIEIFDETTGALVTECATGSSCSVYWRPSGSGDQLVAFVSSYGATLPPPAIVASSNTLNTIFYVP